MPHKVIFIGPAYPYRGGIAAFNENLAAVFEKNGWKCKIFTFIQQYPNLLFPGKNQLITDENAKPSLSIKRAIYSTNPLNWLKIGKEITQENPDLVICQYWMPFMAPAFGTILRGIKKSLPATKTVTIVHNFKPHESRIGDKQLNKFLVNRSDTLVSLSDSVYNEINTSVSGKDLINLFHPIYDHYGKLVHASIAKERLGWQKDTAYLLFFGLVRAYKGLDTLIKALSLVSTNKKYKLVIAGEFYEDQSKYTRLIDKLNLRDRIIIINEYIPNDKVPDLFCAASAIVLPYKRATQSGVIPIALHFHRPVIATRVGGLTELLESYNLGLTSESNPHSLADKIAGFLNEEENLSSDFKDLIDILSWQSFYDKLTKGLNIRL